MNTRLGRFNSRSPFHTLRRLLTFALIGALPLLAAGCGDQAELTERAFVMGMAFDRGEDGKLLLTLQIYKPSQSVAAKGKTGRPYINVKTSGSTVMEAIRDLTVHIGRKAQFSHLRSILISEKLAREGMMSELLDIFYRDNEPRLTCSVIITRGKAGPYLEVAPLIENTVSQQYYLNERVAAKYSGKSVHASLLKLAIQLRSASASAMVPYLTQSSESGTTKPSMAGIAIIRDGRMTDKLTGTETEGLLMLNDVYHGGVVEIPCGSAGGDEQGKGTESVELLQFHTAKKINIKGDTADVAYRMHADAAALGLACSHITTSTHEKELSECVAERIKAHAESAFRHLQRSQADALGIGNAIYQRHPALWRAWEKDWPERFAKLNVTFEVDVLFASHGTSGGKPFLDHPDN
ncbi:Ger(x)C family spore germination protein [Paenibacillus methanolicus]|uniref:Spore germination protein KC n=1 Tax=Paenibacillus methanolicus TaxID=582686 RepID=A0A5S5C462_9BACL|nr:Ger(x)C family spore germination protein [Paenibacillus methanolicus]TYP73929.1 spore germination protein KC [Paenibacillus methanolicus]